jgi:hypothetical protein
MPLMPIILPDTVIFNLDKKPNSSKVTKTASAARLGV